MLKFSIRSLFFVLLLPALPLLAQVQQPGRFEIELEPFEDSYEVLSGEEKGVLVYRPMNFFESGRELWRFIKLDTTLKKQWLKEYYIDREHIFRGYAYHDNNYFFLFQITARGGRDMLLLQMNDFTGDTLQHTIRNLVPLQLEAFEISDNAALIGGYFNNDPVVIYYDLTTRKTKVLPGIFGNKTELVQVKIEDDQIKVLVTARTIDNRNTLAIKTYDLDGNYLDNYVFNPVDETGLIFGRVAEADNVGTLICGTYGARRSDYSRGLFIAQHKYKEGQVLKYFNYADLDNFFTYMRAKRQLRIANRINRKKIKGKKIKFNYRLLVHEVLKTGDNYIMLGEAFYPKYETGTAVPISYGGYASYLSPHQRIPVNFAGYKYTHAVVIAFDKNGRKLWDNSFQIEDVLSFSLDQFVHADVVGDKVILLYKYDNEIRSKIISGGEVLEGRSYDNLRLTFADDVASKNTFGDIGGLEKWYGHYFYAYGIQKIKNLRDSGVKLNRRVFYINKIIYTDTADEDKEKGLSED